MLSLPVRNLDYELTSFARVTISPILYFEFFAFLLTHVYARVKRPLRKHKMKNLGEMSVENI